MDCAMRFGPKSKHSIVTLLPNLHLNQTSLTKTKLKCIKSGLLAHHSQLIYTRKTEFQRSQMCRTLPSTPMPVVLELKRQGGAHSPLKIFWRSCRRTKILTEKQAMPPTWKILIAEKGREREEMQENFPDKISCWHCSAPQVRNNGSTYTQPRRVTNFLSKIVDWVTTSTATQCGGHLPKQQRQHTNQSFTTSDEGVRLRAPEKHLEREAYANITWHAQINVESAEISRSRTWRRKLRRCAVGADAFT